LQYPAVPARVANRGEGRERTNKKGERRENGGWRREEKGWMSEERYV
jgi:hypothetical protein